MLFFSLIFRRAFFAARNHYQNFREMMLRVSGEKRSGDGNVLILQRAKFSNLLAFQNELYFRYAFERGIEFVFRVGIDANGFIER